MEATTFYLLFFCTAFGAFSITALYHFAIYLQQKDKVFLAYSHYLFLYAIFILIRILDARLTNFIPLDYATVYHGDELMAKLTLVAYVNFVGPLFVTPDMKFHLLGWKIMRVVTYTYCIVYVFLLWINAPQDLLEKMSYASTVFLLLLGLLLIFKVFKFYKNPFYQLIIAGSIMLAFATLGGTIYNINAAEGKLNLTAYAIMLCGGIPEIIFLSSALGYRLKMVYKERAQAQQDLIIQLQRNEQLAQTINEELEQMVKIRTDEIKEKSALLEHEKEQKLLAEFDKQIAEAQLTALNAQMNPHFIFNCMNSIQKYILKNEKTKALEFLQNFSDLMRSVLDSSTKTKVSLDEEIRMLEKYMLLEQQRLDDKFEYRIEVAKDFQADFFEIPGMIIQPYIENAIWHGLMNMPDRGLLKLGFEKDNSSIRCIVEDNGIGRKKSSELRNNKSGNRKGYGMAISQKRMELLQKENQEIPEILVEDIVSHDRQVAGTRVTIYFHID